MLLVIRLISDLRGDDDLRLRIDGRLAVIALDHAPLRPRGRHDPALWIGEVPLGLWVGNRAAGLRGPTPTRPFRVASLAGCLLDRGRRLRLLFQHGLGGPDGLQTLRPTRHLGGQLVTPSVRTIGRIVPRIRRLRLLEQRRDLRVEPCLLRHHPAITHRLVLRRIRLDLRAIQGDVSQLDQARPLTECQDLHEQVGQRGQMLLAEVTDRPEIRPLVRREDAKRHILFQLAGNLPRSRYAHGVGIEQNRDQHPRIVGGIAARHPTIGLEDRRQVQFGDQIRDEVGQVVLWQPLPQRRRQQPQLVGLIRTEGAVQHRQASKSWARVFC